jgi:hypothetical protein
LAKKLPKNPTKGEELEPEIKNPLDFLAKRIGKWGIAWS